MRWIHNWWCEWLNKHCIIKISLIYNIKIPLKFGNLFILRPKIPPNESHTRCRQFVLVAEWFVTLVVLPSFEKVDAAMVPTSDRELAMILKKPYHRTDLMRPIMDIWEKVHLIHCGNLLQVTSHSITPLKLWLKYDKRSI